MPQRGRLSPRLGRQGRFGDLALERWLPWVASLALVLAGWTAITLARTTFVVEGTIESVRDASFVGSQILIAVRAATGPDQLLRMGGRCGSGSGDFAICEDPYLPIGSRIRVEISDFRRPAGCQGYAATVPGDGCPPRLHGGKSMQRVLSIAVDGRALTTGWWNSQPPLLWLPYAWVAALAASLARHRWSVSAIPPYTLLALAAIFVPLALPVTIGLWTLMA